MHIFVIRHGESEDDLSDSYGGAANFRLTARGKEQAASVASRLTGSGISAIYSSPLARARESADIISVGLGGVSIETVSGLRERNTYGVVSGHTRAQAQDLFGYILDTMPEKPGQGQACAPGGEEYEPFVNRVRSAFEYVVDTAGNAGHEHIAIVTHGKFSLALFQTVLRLTESYDSDHASINVLEYHSAKFAS